ncbi:ATP-dependent RNA helicase [Treponema primitia ZAS-2]|uniref:ATP-dependent RNA helicase n=1 Tax=Treponema primitia (strain ATCC BAA-887 / DSM 12427 / ZAS-2) TaxID=545694 RepID=F5YJ46_TREPZ|nr:DEAD/DEAH box helicase [Treponema primitia]AEF84612.1 ATP-dependent RNA helicase [Treponema primitia ZAS-2]
MSNEDGGFSGLGVGPFFIERLKERGIREPVEIQKRVIPRMLRGERALFCSPTGTGKTFAYLIPILQTLMEGDGTARGPAALILAPTYELCSQIKQEADFLLQETPFKASLLIGSAAMGRQIDMLKKDRPLLVVGNPGRVHQLAQMGKLRLNLQFLVFDEADRLTAEELYGDTRDLCSLIRGDPLSAACSATLPVKCRDRILPLMGEPVFVEESAENVILRDMIEHWAFFSEERDKIGVLRSFLAAAHPRKALVFTARTAQVGNIVTKLQHHKIPALGLFGDMDKKMRKQAMDDFRSGRALVLVASDLAARGLDIPDLTHIIALDTGEDPDAYIHRAGRTARAGKRGVMATIGDEGDLRNLSKLEKKLGIAVYPKELYGGKVCVPEADEEE